MQLHPSSRSHALDPSRLKTDVFVLVSDVWR